MERFNTMLEAAEFAATLCTSWRFATSNDRYDVKDLLVLAAMRQVTAKTPSTRIAFVWYRLPVPSVYARRARTSTGCF